MSDNAPINLNRVRKARDRQQRKAEADANSVKFGRTKAQRIKEAMEAEKMRRHLDGLKFEDE